MTSVPSNVSYWSASALLFAMALTSWAPVAGAAAPLTPGSAAVESEAETGNRAMTFAIGDRLKITLFENLRPEVARESVLASLVERPEIAGEYVVQKDGRVFLPLLGDLAVAGQSHAEVEQAVESDFRRLFGSPVKLIIQLLEREPIYVTGPVARPGTFKYVPGMSVLHALALAGGIEGISTDQWKRLDLSRERERLQKTQERLGRLLAFRDLLLAERERTGAAPSKQLIEMVGESRASRLFSNEQRLRVLEVRKRADEENAFASLIEATKRELNLLRERLGHSEASLKEKTEYVKGLRSLRIRGVITDVNFNLAQSELSNAQERWHEVRTTIAQLERKLLETEQQKTRADVDAQIKRQLEIKTTQATIAEDLVSQGMLAHLFADFPETSVPEGRGRISPQFTIVRRTTNGIRQLASEQLSMLDVLEPGDIVQVGRMPLEFHSVGTR